MPQNVGRDAAEFSTAAGGHEACLVAAQLCDLVLFHKDPFALGALSRSRSRRLKSKGSRRQISESLLTSSNLLIG